MSSRPAPLIPPRLRAILVRVPYLVRIYRYLRQGPLARDRGFLATLTVGSLLLGVLAANVSVEWFSPSILILVVLAGGLQLRPRSLGVLLAVVCASVVYVAAEKGIAAVGPGLLVALVVTSVLAILLARTRGQLGVQGLRGDAMLLDLRDRLKAQSQLPKLPKGWDSKVVLKQAGGSSFGGDFVVATRDGDRVELALVDVSGKGVDAGTRALMLSGTFGGLLGSVAGEDFLPACNAYLHRQREREGFVTAVHLRLDLSTGEYVITSAGHPPVVKFEAGSGTWRVAATKGVVLGVVPDLHCEPDSGVLRKGDALLLYTDGLIEEPGRDIDAGLDRLLGEAERLLPSGFKEGARTLVQTMSAGHNDDCALVLIWRP
ncbi:PP2C family protein-serine/threonine phosphatase [Bailinhaonella thermotolerans]|uniref:Serine/threonine-protein phosphatase n=1 Tax=Bailinhaonella thermotolerans TaxID=1070861 RepID=A0A3A4A2U8_9ACTN|nr:PP2C family protein-serine/threonine phosphatase [Bailinhaonella thermotolerans]RJL22755.1 serine/threonine-protein phosphatase [Bailinhaonella thermotolerans]